MRSSPGSATWPRRSSTSRSATSGEGLSEEETARLQSIEVTLDRCGTCSASDGPSADAGKSPDEATLRTEGTVEGYRQ